MRIEHESPDRLVLVQRFLAIRAGGLALVVAGAIAFIVLHDPAAAITALTAALCGVLGLILLVGPPAWRVELERTRGIVTVRGGCLFRPRHATYPLSEITGVSIEVGGANEDGTLDRLALHQVGGGWHWAGDASSADLEPARAAIDRWLAGR